MEEKSLFDWLFEETEEEKRLKEELDHILEENAKLPENIAYEVREKELYGKLREAAQKRLAEGRKHRKPIKPENTRELSVEEIKKRASENKERRLRENPGPVNDLLSRYANLSEHDRKRFMWCLGDYNRDKYNEDTKLEPYENPITTEKNIEELHYILVQTVLDFINDNELSDIDAVSFSADSLQESARYGEWCPATDSFLGVEGVQEESPEEKYKVRKIIGKSM